MSPWLAYALGCMTPAAAIVAVALAVQGTEPTGYECTGCDWSTGGYRPALIAWCRRKWHVHVTRRLGRCHR